MDAASMAFLFVPTTVMRTQSIMNGAQARAVAASVIRGMEVIGSRLGSSRATPVARIASSHGSVPWLGIELELEFELDRLSSSESALSGANRHIRRGDQNL